MPGLFGPDGPHPFGAALRALTRWIAWIAWPRPATNNSSHMTEPLRRYPGRRDSSLGPYANATNNLNRLIWLGCQDSNLGMAGSKPAIRISRSQVTDSSYLLVPSNPINSPPLSPKLSPALRVDRRTR